MGYGPGLTARIDGTVRFAWRFATSGTKRQLAPGWATSTVVAQYDAVFQPSAGVVYVATTGGTTATTGSGPTGQGAGITDGSVTWKGYPLAGVQSLVVVDDDASGAVKVGDVDLQLVPAPPNDGSASAQPPRPDLVYVIASAGTPAVVVVAVS